MPGRHAKDDASSVGRRLRLGLYFGDYAHLSGCWPYWVQAIGILGHEWVPLWDQSFRQEAVLGALDAVVVPGGFCCDARSAFGGETGRLNLRKLVSNGTPFVGTCYGANIAMASGQERDIPHVGLAPGRALDSRQRIFSGITNVDYHSSSPFYQADTQATTHMNGPLFDDGEYEVIGRFSGYQPGPFEVEPPCSIEGKPSAIMARCGRGRVFVFSGHPEMPVNTEYSGCVSRVSRGELSIADAVKKVWQLPRLSTSNARLLQTLFRSFPRTSNRPAHCIDAGEWTSQRVALLSSATELLKLRFREVEFQLERITRHGKTRVMTFVHELIHRRLRQVHHILNALDPEALLEEPAVFAKVSLVIVLLRIYCGCDHPGIIRQVRLDYLVSRARRLSSAKREKRARAERELAEVVMRRIVSDLDTFVCAYHGAKG